ncbi:uncharacterized protein FIBRA_00502 [Fibroporia radiculosa]|uniref:Threonine/serine exporter-like N-terminal domain-containing protein n=1 Tax=Fibroporia radiculosa TaxID=599839 RepID=J4G0B8_9APHY|nr:uncharacterized protein FIBRA_00502 [Fibroporia radiculosa]CCL98503.1 predicted protein [Fibroporia radiculosa]
MARPSVSLSPLSPPPLAQGHSSRAGFRSRHDPAKYDQHPTPHPGTHSDTNGYFEGYQFGVPSKGHPAGPAHPALGDDAQRDRPLSPWSSPITLSPPPVRAPDQAEHQTHPPEDAQNTGDGYLASILGFGFPRASLRGSFSSRRDSVYGDQASVQHKARPRRRSSFALHYDSQDNEDDVEKGRPSKHRYRDKVLLKRGRKKREIVRHAESRSIIVQTEKLILMCRPAYIRRQKFVLKLAKALLTFGAPSHRIESQLEAASVILKLDTRFVHFPNIILVTFLDSDTRTSEVHFVRAGGRVALTALYNIHNVYRLVLRDKLSATQGTEELDKIIKAGPLYGIYIRCLFAFICASIICVLAFGGSLLDMFISGASASILQYLGLRAAAKSSIYANVYEISVSIIVSFLARVLGSVPGQLFCYTSISSAGVVLILPGFTVLISALELAARNTMCGSVRMVYAIIYTLFLGFGLTIGSDFYLVINPEARHVLAATDRLEAHTYHGHIIANNASLPLADLGGTYSFTDISEAASHVIKGCYRGPHWPWWRQPFPWWAALFLVPLYSVCSSLANLQSLRSAQLPIMVAFSCAAYAANKGASVLVSDRSDIVSAFGATVIGLCGNVYSRIIGGTAFTSMVTGVLFLVPSAIGNGGGLIQTYNTSSAQYSNSFDLGIRMIEVAIGVTIGLFAAQMIVYALGRRKSAGHFAF